MKKTRKHLALLSLLICILITLQLTSCNAGGNYNTDSTTEQSTPSNNINPDKNTSDEGTNITETSVGMRGKPSINFDTAINIAQIGSGAEVTTATGFTYSAIGFENVQNNKFLINQNFTITPDRPFFEAFNRLTICFVSDAPLNCSVKYKVDGNTVDDLFYLEAGKQTFCSLIKGYLEGKQASELISITFSTCLNEETSFALCSISTEIYEVYAENVYYIENDYYLMGIRLSWGGGICYLQDFDNTITGIENLINQADTGRLVQQSYYGTYSNGDYVEGNFGGTRWPYNPVQGGDVHGNPSRIIDVVVEDELIYIKAQPQDWGHNGKLTISYMENTYILEDDCVRVDNRFVDFSGWEHRYSSQELPAFYTLSYFGDFTYYSGVNSWENEPLTTYNNLKFWGDPAYHNDCVFQLRNSNTETWCAWTNSDANYGIGLYVPNVDTLLAGRNAYNGSKDSRNGATNYVAPLCTLKIVSFDPIEYSYLMTTGSLEEIRETFRDNKDFATNEALHKNYISDRIADDSPSASMKKLEFSNLDATLNLRATNTTSVTFSDTEKAAAMTVTTAFDPHVTISYGRSSPTLKAEDYTTIKITYMVPTTNSKSTYIAELFLCTGATVNATAGKSVRSQIVSDGEYHTLEISVSELDFWSGNVNAIRFDYFDDTCAQGDVIYITSIELS